MGALWLGYGCVMGALQGGDLRLPTLLSGFSRE